MYTRRNAFVALGLIAVSLIAGCGGGGDNDNDTTSPFVGSYSGAFNTNDGQQGTTVLAVAGDGRVTGTVSNTTINAQGPVSGKIENSGDADITFTYTGQGSAQLRGRIAYNETNTALEGNLTQSVGGTTVGTVSVSFTKNP